MEELSVEQKAKAYDEGILKLRGMMPNWERLSYNGKTFLQDLVYIFPELKESEDEKIRKAIVKMISDIDGGSPFEKYGIIKKEALAWLEKQGEKGTNGNEREIPISEQNLTGKVEPKFKVGNKIKLAKEPKYPAREIIAIRNDAYYFDEEVYLPFSRQDEWELVGQKHADLKTKAGNWYICDKEVMNENMVTAFHRNEIYYCPKDGYLDVGGALFEVGCLDVFRLATEKEIPQPKQEWSEEDEKMLDTVIEDIIRLAGPKVCYHKDVEWLKSLRPQSQWKPSKEQIIALRWVLNNVPYNKHKEEISGLLDQIKDL